jgi:hypothetical protein
MEALPQELVCHILGFIEISDICHISLTCSLFKSCLETNLVRRRILGEVAKAQLMLEQSIRIGNTHMLEFILSDNRVDPAIDSHLLLCEVAWRGDAKLMATLLNDKRVNPAANNNMPLRVAFLCGNWSIIELLRRRMNKRANEALGTNRRRSLPSSDLATRNRCMVN